MEMSSKNLQEIEVNTFQRPIPEINRLKFPKYDLILPWYRGYQTNCSEMSLISLKSSISQLFKTASHIFIEMLCEILEHFKHFHFPATNCIFKQYLLTRSLYTLGVPFYRLVRRVSLNPLTDRAAQTKCSETCYIPLNSWEFQLFRHVSLIFIEMSSENLQEIEVNTFQRPMPDNKSIEIPEIWLDFTMLQGVGNKLFRNESYITKKFNISTFQNCFSYVHWSVERESRTL